MKKIFTFVLLILISLNFNNKAFSIEADVFVQSTVNRAAKTLGGGLTKEERIVKLKEIAKDTVDITGIGFYSLGKHRKNLSNEQLENYKIVFEAYFLKSFSSRLAEYSNPEIEVNSKNVINANYTIVSSTLVATNSRPEVKIEWRVYTKDPNNLLIRDLIIEGLSLARTQKEEFSSIINSNDGKIEALLKNLSDFSAK
ncbi:ABC transporter substrate-binding protein [Candidatus Pelagibacter sp.]|jgi:phospholipid transport system substrate-binding protein|nr:ABC transporter substrate-binding protein [Candidatus Pelagibacter sp.]